MHAVFRVTMWGDTSQCVKHLQMTSIVRLLSLPRIQLFVRSNHSSCISNITISYHAIGSLVVSCLSF